MQFKVGDKVRILLYATSVGVEREEVGKVGVVTHVNDNVYEYCGIRVKMNEICVERGYIPTWSVGDKMIKLVLRKNQQLLFGFMER